jgi:hypothetical protein
MSKEIQFLKSSCEGHFLAPFRLIFDVSREKLRNCESKDEIFQKSLYSFNSVILIFHNSRRWLLLVNYERKKKSRSAGEKKLKQNSSESAESKQNFLD